MQKASLQHPLGQDASIPKQLEPSRLAYLTARLRAGNISPSERDEIGRGFIRLALKIAANYAVKNPSKGDDYASCGLFGVAYAISKAQEKLVDDNITPWISSCIHRFIRRFRETDHIVHTPASTYHKAKKEGTALLVISAITMDDREINAGANNRKSSTYHRIKIQVTGGFQAFKELLNLSANDDKDREILRLRSYGYNDVEIAEMIGCSTTSVNVRRAAMEARFNRLNREES